MRCPKCGAEPKNPTLKFCTKCGASLETSGTSETLPEWKKYISSESSTPSAKASFKSPESYHHSPEPVHTERVSKEESSFLDVAKDMASSFTAKSKKKKYYIPSNISPEIIKPTENEIPVKQYVFSKLKFPLTKYSAESIIQVTNKRIIYNLIGASIVGSERTHTEFPIDDVSSVSVEKSSRFSLIMFLGYLLTTIFSFALASGLSIITTQYYQYVALSLAIIGVVCVFILSKTRHNYIYHFASTLLMNICSIKSKTFGNGEIVTKVISFLLACFALWFLINDLVAYLKGTVRPTIGVVITSKGGAAETINDKRESKFSVSIGAIKNLCNSMPTEETDVMIAELGAMVSDIQKLGDYGIEKWKEK